MKNPDEGSGKIVKWLVVIAAVGGFGFCGCGVFGAIGIPAFLKYIKRSKASEAETITKQLTDEALVHYEQNCEWPAELPRHTNPANCCGGEKCMPDTEALDVWSRAPLSAPSDPTYFSYGTKQVDPETYEIIAESDFTCGGEMHTVTVRLEAIGDCQVQASPSMILNEFE